MFAYVPLEFLRLTGVMVYPVGEDGLCGRLPVRLGGRHAGKTIYTNGGGDAGHCGGADAWRSAATCVHGTDGQRQRHTVRIFFFLFPRRHYGEVLL